MQTIVFLLLNHWAWVTHICICKLTIIGSDNGLLPRRRQAIIWTCKICGLQYVGQTKRTFHERLYEHFRDILNKTPDKPLGRHFDLPSHSPDVTQIRSHILAFITKPSNTSAALQMRLKFERDWIYRLRTNLPHGLNALD